MTNLKTEQQIRQQVQVIVLQLAPALGVEGSPHVRLVEDLAYHSLAFLELGFALEDELGVPQIERETAMGISTLGQLEEHVLKTISRSGPGSVAGVT
jgi:acyl carrier protein